MVVKEALNRRGGMEKHTHTHTHGCIHTCTSTRSCTHTQHSPHTDAHMCVRTLIHSSLCFLRNAGGHSYVCPSSLQPFLRLPYLFCVHLPFREGPLLTSLHLSITRSGLGQTLFLSGSTSTFSHYLHLLPFSEPTGIWELTGPTLTLLCPHSLGNLVVWRDGSLTPVHHTFPPMYCP